MDEAWLLMGELWFGVSDDTETKVNEAYKLVQNTLAADPNSPYALDLASMIERSYLNELDKACGRLEKMIKISDDPSNMTNTANLARNCGNYDQSLGIFKKVLEKAKWLMKQLNECKQQRDIFFKQ